jgi:3-isopropylmalate/(R)-2-methylmalate dehydratase small subunit
MKRVQTIVGPAVPMPGANVDTDQILPKQFLRTISREGLAGALFFDWRFDESGEEISDFILNQPAYRDAVILLAGENFACGSSREHAVWSLMDFGIQCAIAPSFAEIFAGNSLNNGLLLITLPKADVEALQAEATGNGADFRVDLPSQTVTAPSGRTFAFEIDPGAKAKLLAGLDAIGETLILDPAIRAFEASRRDALHWLAPAAQREI